MKQIWIQEHEPKAINLRDKGAIPVEEPISRELKTMSKLTR